MRKIFIAVALLLFVSTAIATPVTVTRTLPSTGYMGSTVDVSLSIAVGVDKPNGVIIREYIPAGWIVKATNPAPTTINTTEIAWVLSGGGFVDRTLTYTLQVPNSTGIAGFQGIFLYNNKSGNPVTFNISGATMINVIAPQVIITVSRVLPKTVMRGNTFTATLRVGVDAYGAQAPNGLIIKEYLPLGWNITTSTPTENSFNASIGEIKWVITEPTGITNMTVYYTANVPGTEAINSSGLFNGLSLYTFADSDVLKNITGSASVTVVPVPGDINGDNKIGDFELLDFIQKWVQAKADDFALLAAIDVWASS